MGDCTLMVQIPSFLCLLQWVLNEHGNIKVKDYVFLPHGEEESSPTQFAPMTLLRLTVFWKIRTGRIYSIATRSTRLTRICLIRLCLCPKESDQFRFLRVVSLSNFKLSVGLILTKVSGTRITIPLDLSTWSFIHLRRFFHCRRTPSLHTPTLFLFPERSA
jgi:hypothetical protein